MNKKYIDKNVIKGEIILLLASILWGSCFLFQGKGMDYIGSFTLGAFSFLIGGSLLIPIIYAFSFNKKAKRLRVQYRKKDLIKSGVLCGIVMFFAATFQQIGLIYAISGKAGFITAMEIIVVAIAVIFITKKIFLNIVLGIVIALSGMYYKWNISSDGRFYSFLG